MQCDICSAPGDGMIVKAGDMSEAARRGFNPFSLRLMPEVFVGMYTDEHAPERAIKWAQSAISGSSSQSDWNLCSSCMAAFSKYLSEPASHVDLVLEDQYEKRGRFDNSLMSASFRGDLEGVRALLAAGDWRNLPNHQDIEGHNALWYAATQGHVDVVNALIAAGADVNLLTKEGKTALMRAAGLDSADCLMELITTGDLAADPLGAVAAAAGTVSRKSAAGGVACKDGKQHRTPTSSGEIARRTEVGQKGATYKLRTNLRVRFAFGI